MTFSRLCTIGVCEWYAYMLHITCIIFITSKFYLGCPVNNFNDHFALINLHLVIAFIKQYFTLGTLLLLATFHRWSLYLMTTLHYWSLLLFFTAESLYFWPLFTVWQMWQSPTVHVTGGHGWGDCVCGRQEWEDGRHGGLLHPRSRGTV